jgi:hypothetical protein
MTDGVVGGLAHGLRARDHANAWHLFLALVSLASLGPLVVMPLASHVVPDGASLFIVSAIIFLGSNFHVALTGWFYTDPEMLGHFRSRPVRYLLVPALLIPGCAAAFYFLDRSISVYLVLPFLAWQLWHYQKQNVGLLSFIAAGTDGVPLSIWERRTLMLAAVTGILGFFSLGLAGPLYLSEQFALLHRIGLAIAWVLPVVFCIAVVQCAALRANPLRLAFFLFGTSFFVPTFVFSDPMSAFVTYAMSHGLQYFVFMGFVSWGKNTKKPMASLIKLLLIAALGGFILDRMRAAPAWLEFRYGYAMYGAFLGVVMTHFVLDAGIWRLREQFQRRYMRDKFHFVFNR